MRLLMKALKKRCALTLLSFCVNGVLVGGMLWWNAQLAGMIDTLTSGNALSVNIIIAAIVSIFMIGVINFAKIYVSSYTCEMITHDLRMGYAQYFISLPVAEIEKQNAGEQNAKLQNEIADVSKYINNNLFQIIGDSISFILTLVWLFILNPKLIMIILLPLLLIMIYIFYSSKVIGKATEISLQAKGQMNGFADTLLVLFPIIRLYEAAFMVTEKYKKEVCKWEQQTIRAEQVRARLMSLSGLLSNTPLLLLLWVGGNMVAGQLITIGTLYIFINLSGNISGMMMNMPGYMASFRQFLVTMKRLSPQIILVKEEDENK